LVRDGTDIGGITGSVRRVPIALDCPGCNAATRPFGVDGVRGVFFRCSVHSRAHVWVLLARDVYEAPIDGKAEPGWSPASAAVMTVAPVYETCPRCERRIEIVHDGSVVDGAERDDPWRFIGHSRMREDASGAEPCPASGRNQFSATH
jgi:hypothetical protein